MVVRVLYQATLLLSASSYPAISDVRLIFIGLQRHIDQYLSTYEEDECYMAQSIMHKLEEYWDIVEKSTVLPTLLDPRSKLMTFVTCEERSAAINVLCERMLNYGEVPSNASTISQRKKHQGIEKKLALIL